MKKFFANLQEITIELIVLICKVIQAILILSGLLAAIVVVSPFLILGGLIRVIRYLFFQKELFVKP